VEWDSRFAAVACCDGATQWRHLPSVAKSTPDGYTLLGAAPGAMTVGTAIWKKIPYDIFKDFIPISLMAD